MPKLLVLFQSPSPEVITLAEAALEGARSVRFAEADLRRLGESDAGTHAGASDGVGRAHRTLEDVDSIAHYDGLILVLPGAGDAAAGVTEILAPLGGALANKVGSAISPAEGDGRSTVLWSALTPMADYGMILVPPPFTSTGEAAPESARRLGKRVAEVIGWVTHARSHHHHDAHRHDRHSHPHH